jgi:adenylosuccinate lyase
VTAEDVRAFIESLDLPAEAAKRLMELTPGGYIGLAADLVDSYRPRQ